MSFKIGNPTAFGRRMTSLFPIGADEGLQSSYREDFGTYETRARLELAKSWVIGDPKSILDKLINEMPDSFQVSPKYEPERRPSDIELYFLSKLPKLLDMLRSDTPKGGLTAIESAYCLRDSTRTKKFLKGLSEALGMVHSKDTVHLCDAGSGAIPIFAIYAALHSPRVSCTCLEINPNSAEISRVIVDTFRLQDRIKVVNADARSYEPDRPIDILISETMNHGLFDEPLVQIMSKLAPRSLTGIIRLPQTVEIKATVIPESEYKGHGYVRTVTMPCPYVEQGWHTVFQYNAGDPITRISFPITANGPGKNLLLISHEVQIGSYRLGIYESLMTLPKPFRIRCKVPTSLGVEYEPGAQTANIRIYERTTSSNG